MMLEELSLLVSPRSVLFQSWRFDLLLSFEAIEGIWSNASNRVCGLICFVVLQALSTRSSIMYIRYLYWCSCQTQRLDCSYKLTWQLVTTSMISDPECATLHFEMPSFHSAKTCKTYSEEIKYLWLDPIFLGPSLYLIVSGRVNQFGLRKTWEGWRISSSFPLYGSLRPGDRQRWAF